MSCASIYSNNRDNSTFKNSASVYNNARKAEIIQITHPYGNNLIVNQKLVNQINRKEDTALDQSSDKAYNQNYAISNSNHNMITDKIDTKQQDNKINHSSVNQLNHSDYINNSSNHNEDTQSSNNKNNNFHNTWITPVKHGVISDTYDDKIKGVNIKAKIGQHIYAVNNGKVIYSGNSLKEYGNLIIIKHDKNYISVYAYNQKNLVSEGIEVKIGQKIATVGNSPSRLNNHQNKIIKDADNNSNKNINELYGMLHFELRKNSIAIDPMSIISFNININ